VISLGVWLVVHAINPALLFTAVLYRKGAWLAKQNPWVRHGIGAAAVFYVLFLAFPVLRATYQWSTAECAVYTVGKTWIKGNPNTEVQQYLATLTDSAGVAHTVRVEDDFFWLQFNSSDKWAKLKEGSQQNVKLAGIRFGFLSWYPNVVRICN
jgi:hypothetical protein